MSIKSSLVQRLAKKNPSLKNSEIKFILNVFFTSILNYLKNNNRVELRGFGSFSLRTYIIKTMNNRLHKEQYFKIYFRSSKKLINLINK